MTIAVIDGMGGGIGSGIISQIRKEIGNSVTVIALGTNSSATERMIHAGAGKGATGENAIVVNANKVDLIIGPIAVIVPDSLLGEITDKMAYATAVSEADKLLLPVSKCGVHIVGTSKYTLSQLLDETIMRIKELIAK